MSRLVETGQAIRLLLHKSNSAANPLDRTADFQKILLFPDKGFKFR